MFTQDCYIKKNTPGLREYLRNIGYDVCTCCDDGLGWLFTYKGEVHSVDTEEQAEFMKDIKDDKSNSIECEKEAQFKAISALRSDTDDNQWFTDGKDWYYYIDGDEDFLARMLMNRFHKATVQKLIEHFK